MDERKYLLLLFCGFVFCLVFYKVELFKKDVKELFVDIIYIGN